MGDREELLRRARVLAEQINFDRFAGEMPSAEHTVDLCEILDVLLEDE